MGGKNSYESIKRYEDKAYDKVLIRMPKGRKELIKTHAERQGESINAFINRAMVEAMERDLAAREGTYEPRKHSDGTDVLPGFFEDYGVGEGGIVADNPAGEGTADGD